jgi:hypothetical protein
VISIFCFIFGLAFGLVVHRAPSTALQTPRLLVGRADNVPDGYAAFCSGTLHLGEIDTEFLGLLLGCMRGVRQLLVLPAGGLLSLLGGLPCGLLTLLGSLSGGVLRLLSCTSGSILGLSRDLACLLGRLSSGFLGLSGYLTGGVLRLLGHPLRDLLHLLLGLLDGLAHRVFHSHILGRLIHRTLDLRVGVDHLLDLGLSVAVGKLLRVLLKLLAVVLNLAPYAAHRLPVETQGFLQVPILLRLLLAILDLFT